MTGIGAGVRLVDEEQFGPVLVNNHAEAAPRISFGGAKSSGIGRAGGRPACEYAGPKAVIVYKSADRV